MSLTPVRLKAWRESQKYTQEDVAAALGMTSLGYRKFEQGQRRINKRMRLAVGMIAEFGLGADFDGEHIFSGDDKP